jgi:predicted helicase
VYFNQSISNEQLGNIMIVIGLKSILSEFREKSSNNRDLGTLFEKLIKSYFENEPLYKQKFKNVWMWNDWPYKWGQDSGIDLITEDFEENFYAIQCKFFSEEHQIKKDDIDSFFTESGRKFETKAKAKKSFVGRIIVSTSDNWSTLAEKSLDEQTIPVSRIRLQDLEESVIDWSKYSLEKPNSVKIKEKKKLRPHQKQALERVTEGFKNGDRGKLIMACGTGKTFTALKIAENQTKGKGIVLFLVPSISLLSQTLREWSAESEIPFNALAVCSDTKVGKNSEDISKHDLAIPATTDAKKLVETVSTFKHHKLTVVFSTYQSIKVIEDAQKKGFPEFDLIICDEAHRTTGVTLVDDEESQFVRIHQQKFVKGDKRLYMTATPRIFADGVKSKADEAGAVLCSMDDENLFGPTFHKLGFGEAVSKGLLADYKVLVLAVDEGHVSSTMQNTFGGADKEIKLNDIVKIIGCWNGLSKKIISEQTQADDPNPMKRAVAFASTIKDSKKVAELFQGVISTYLMTHNNEENNLRCEVDHVDGSYNVLLRNQKLDWLKAETEADTCRILTNARCLSEGVDVPALDAVLFLNPRNSIVDVVQSVGRIMRVSEGKKYGYVILPIGVPAGVRPEEALKDNEKYKVVWQVLQSLRAHDDRFNAMINQIELNKARPDQIQIIGVGGSGDGEGEGSDKTRKPTQLEMPLNQLEEWKDAIYAKMVAKCGDRRYWEQWASDVAKIAQQHTTRIEGVLSSKDSTARKAFDRFLKSIQKNINPSISEPEAIEMLSQHLITRPVFDALFENYSFTQKNPVSKAMQTVLDKLEKHALESEVEKLKGFYDSVKLRVKGISNAEGRQKVIVELYDKFFKLAFPKMTERLGIVYTPVEVVDFIIHSAEFALKKHFGKSLTNEGVHILDPFTGTGTFIVRLLQSGLIKPNDLERKYKNELHANEIVLLAYYIAAINIEETFHSKSETDYIPFNGIVLTDTFQLAESAQSDLSDNELLENNERVKKQKSQKIQVVISNPPYSVGQTDANDNNQNLAYPKLDSKIRDTYANESTATLKNSLYDSYIRAIRWASDRIENGVICFVTNGSFIDGNAADGLRKCLTKEFDTIYCFNLRGNQRTSSELSRQEGGKIFGSGSRTPVAITMFVKNIQKSNHCALFYKDIGDYLTREEKLQIISQFKSAEKIDWMEILPNEEGDWINQRSTDFVKYLPFTDKEEKNNILFSHVSSGLKTNRDAWSYRFSKNELNKSMGKAIDFYNEQLRFYQKKIDGVAKNEYPDPSKVVSNDKKNISWSSDLYKALKNGIRISEKDSQIRCGLYRPYTKQWLYMHTRLVERPGKHLSFLPIETSENLIIVVTGLGITKSFSAIITNQIPDVQLLANGQCFPLYTYDKPNEDEPVNFFDEQNSKDESGYLRRDTISDIMLKKFRNIYEDDNITKRDIFFYVYGLIHSPEYRKKYQNDLKKMLPRVPFVKNFLAFCKAGRELSDLHIGYEAVEPYELIEELSEDAPKDEKVRYKVNKGGMRFAKVNKTEDKTTIIFNQFITEELRPIDRASYVELTEGVSCN